MLSIKHGHQCMVCIDWIRLREYSLITPSIPRRSRQYFRIISSAIACLSKSGGSVEWWCCGTLSSQARRLQEKSQRLVYLCPVEFFLSFIFTIDLFIFKSMSNVSPQLIWLIVYHHQSTVNRQIIHHPIRIRIKRMAPVVRIERIRPNRTTKCWVILVKTKLPIWI